MIDVIDLVLNPQSLVFEHCYVHLKEGVTVKKGDRPKPEDLSIRPESQPTPLSFTPRLISPSQLDQLLLCERKWAFKYVEKMETAQTKAQIFGTEMHAQLEDWLALGKPPASELLMSSGALAHFPPPKSMGLSVEGMFVFRARRTDVDPAKTSWVYFWGFMDAMVQTLVDVEVLDLKTTSDLIWAKESKVTIYNRVAAASVDNLTQREDVAVDEARTQGKLLDEDTQGLTYAIAGMLAASRKVARLKWVYVQTRGAKISRAVPAELTWDRAVAAFALKFQAAERIPELRERKALTAKMLPATPSACGAYGGCPFRNFCDDISPLSSLGSMFAQDKLKTELKEKSMTITNSVAMNKLDALAARKGNNGVPVQEVGAAKPVQPIATMVATVTTTTHPFDGSAPSTTVAQVEVPAEGAMSLKERMRIAKEAAASTSPPPPVEEMRPELRRAASAGSDVETAVSADTSPNVKINGWPGTISVEGKKTLCTVTANGETEIYKHLSRDEVIKLAQAQTPQYVPPAPPPPVVEAPKARKPRTPRIVHHPLADVDAGAFIREFTVYIDIVTHNGPAIPELASLLEPLQEAVASAAGVDDYRLIPYDDAKKAVAVAFAKSFGGPDAPKGEYGISSKVLDKYVLEVLMREAIIRKGVIW